MTEKTKPAKCCPACGFELAAAPAPAAQPLTEDQILELVLPIANNAPSVFLALCYECGPYSVTKLRLSAVELVRAIERAHGIGATHA